MKNTKTEIRFFSVPEWKKEENYLREQHKNGTEEEIFCDDASRLDMMIRVFKGRMTPLLIIFFLVIIPQIIMQSRTNTPENHSVMVFFCVAFVIYLVIFISFAIPLWKYYKSVHKK